MNVYCVGGESHWVHFKDVLISLATQAIKNSMGGDIDHLKASIKLSDDNTYQKLASGARVVTAYTRGQDVGSEIFTLKEFYAAVLAAHFQAQSYGETCREGAPGIFGEIPWLGDSQRQ